jgi:hypothetical protein
MEGIYGRILSYSKWGWEGRDEIKKKEDCGLADLGVEWIVSVFHLL